MEDFLDEDSVNNALEGLYELRNGRVRWLSEVEKVFGVDYGEPASIAHWTKQRKLPSGSLLTPRQITISSESERYLASTALLGEGSSSATVSLPAITMLCKCIRETSFLVNKSEHIPSRLRGAYEIMDTGTCYAVVYTLDKFAEYQMEIQCLAPLELWQRQGELDIDLDS